MTTVYFVRHGESEANQGAWLAAQAEARLTPKGMMQAEQSARRLASVAFDAIYSSDLLRAMDTARAHAALHGCDVIPTPFLREFDAGKLTGMRYEDTAAQYPALYPKLWQESFGIFCPPGGESLPKAAERLEAFVREVARANEGKTLLFVTHAGILRAFWGRILGIAPEELAQHLPFCENAAYSVLQVDENAIHPLCYGVSEDVNESDGRMQRHGTNA